MRWLTPVVLLSASLIIFWINAQGTEQVLIFSFVPRLFPSTAGDVFAQGQATAALVAGVGLLSLFWQIFVTSQSKRRRSELE